MSYLDDMIDTIESVDYIEFKSVQKDESGVYYIDLTGTDVAYDPTTNQIVFSITASTFGTDRYNNVLKTYFYELFDGRSFELVVHTFTGDLLADTICSKLIITPTISEHVLFNFQRLVDYCVTVVLDIKDNDTSLGEMIYSAIDLWNHPRIDPCTGLMIPTVLVYPNE